jgi:hypothetical protein
VENLENEKLVHLQQIDSMNRKHNQLTIDHTQLQENYAIGLSKFDSLARDSDVDLQQKNEELNSMHVKMGELVIENDQLKLTLSNTVDDLERVKRDCDSINFELDTSKMDIQTKSEQLALQRIQHEDLIVKKIDEIQRLQNLVLSKETEFEQTILMGRQALNEKDESINDLNRRVSILEESKSVLEIKISDQRVIPLLLLIHFISVD